MRKHSVAGAQVEQLIRTVLGPVWIRWCEDKSPDGEAVLPRQMVLFIFRGLDSLRTKYESESIRDQAVASYAAIRDGHKRLRVSQLAEE